MFSAIWLAAIALAAAFIVLVLGAYDEGAQHYPRDYPPLAGAKIVFIGSSLTRSALPASRSEQGVLGDGRSCAMFAIPNISEQLSTRLLGHALEVGAETVFLEINAYAQDYESATEAAVLRKLGHALRTTGVRLVNNAKSLLPWMPGNIHAVECRARNTTRTLDAAKLWPGDFYRLRRIEPAYPAPLQSLLARARDSGVEVIFFSTPRPQSLVDSLGAGEFAAHLAHLQSIAAAQGLPLWQIAEPWPDDHFMDILAHTNARGRLRFQQELSHWYEARQ